MLNHPQFLSWPANAGQPVAIWRPPVIVQRFFLQEQSELHLGVPHLRAMTEFI
jgi:hypothetical protein